MSTNTETGLSIKDDLMTTVPKEFFFDGMVLPVPVFLRIKTDYYLMIGKRSDKANFLQLHSFKNNETSVFVRCSDHSALVHYVTDLTDKVMVQKSVPSPIKAKFLLGLTEVGLTAFQGTGFSNVQQLQKISQFIVDLGKTHPNFNDILNLLQTLQAGESRHAMATCMVALTLCEETQVTHRAALDKVAMGCLLHDVGLKYAAIDFMDKPKHLWTPEQNALYETHPIKSVEMLRDLKDVSNDVLLIIAEHHENSLGTGFPKKLRDIKISPLGKIVGLADAFASLLFPMSDKSKTYSSDEALTYIDEILGQPYNKTIFQALRKAIHKSSSPEKLRA